MFSDVFRGHGRGSARGDFGEGAAAFNLATATLMMMWAFEQLFRMSELAPKPGQHASRDPFMWSDIKFFDGYGKELEWEVGGRPIGVPSSMSSRMVPSKTDIAGSKEPLVSPFPDEWQYGVSPTAAGPAMFRYMCRFPVPRSEAQVTPLFRQKRSGRGGSERVTQSGFLSAVKKMCRAARPEIIYKGIGLHAFRVGGMNRLMDLGATAPQICALGRWESDCWRLYARRHRQMLVELTGRMASG